MRTCGVILVLIGLVGVPGAAQAWIVTQLTDKDTDEGGPRVCAGRIVWTGKPPPEQRNQVFLFDGTAVRQLSQYGGGGARISKTHVAWSGGGDPGKGEIWLHDLATGITSQVTDNTYDDSWADLSGSTVVWEGRPVPWSEIFLYDGSQIKQLTNNSHNDESPSICGSNVVWEYFDGHDQEIVLYDGTTVRQLTDNPYHELAPRIHGSTAVWAGFDGNDYEIFMYDIPSGKTKQITDNDVDDRYPKLSDEHIVWPGEHLFLYEIATGKTTQLTHGQESGSSPAVCGSLVVWGGHGPGEYAEIMVYDINSGLTTQITHNDYIDGDAHTDGTIIAWQSFDGVQGDIFMAVVPEPAGIGLWSSVFGLWALGKRRRLWGARRGLRSSAFSLRVPNSGF